MRVRDGVVGVEQLVNEIACHLVGKQWMDLTKAEQKIVQALPDFLQIRSMEVKFTEFAKSHVRQ
jgi:hypothetical protein